LLIVGLLFAVAGFPMLAACGDDSDSSSDASAAPQAQPANSDDALTGTSWVLSEVPTSSGPTLDAAARRAATLEFTDGSVAGSTGCNDFSGTYTVDGDALTIELGPMTQKACTDTALQAQETAIVERLPKVASYAVSEDGLTLNDESDAALLIYAVNDTALAGTSWVATGVNNGKGGVESTTLTDKLTAVFGPDNTLSGSGGCNTFTAEYTVAGSDGLQIAAIAATRMACADDVMQLESEYFAALGNTVSYKISGDSLTLRDGNGDTQVTYTAAG
jgi:heat shock protein HslJ